MPLPLGLAISNAPVEIARHRLQISEQSGFLSEDHRDEPLVIRTAAASPARGQRCKRSDLAVAEVTS
jgi:hypothetical protein